QEAGSGGATTGTDQEAGSGGATTGTKEEIEAGMAEMSEKFKELGNEVYVPAEDVEKAKADAVKESNESLKVPPAAE
ncbi:MAG: hypothetical protein MPJ78_14850, partial [Hyphomicrobiaceae bacterium]|nr:hypothetical protein [Hyphomicrobiaceae bacterium]